MTDQSAAPVPAPRVSQRALEDRRRVVRSIAVGGAVVGATLAGWLKATMAEASPLLRPPGALDEKAFLAACIKCGQCVQVCPVQAIKLGDLQDGVSNGVPYIDARAQACDFSCDATQCVLACPTGALSHLIDKKEQVTIGFARLSRPEGCLARRGDGFKGPARGAGHKGRLRYPEIDRWKPKAIADHPYDLAICDLCVRQCPIEGAIRLEPVSSDPADRRRTPVVQPSCVGCGVCEMICPAEPAAITIDIKANGREPKPRAGAAS